MMFVFCVYLSLLIRILIILDESPRLLQSHLILTNYICESESHSVLSYCLQPHGLYSPWNSPGQNTGVGSLSLLQGISPTQESNQGLLNCRQILYQLELSGKPICGNTIFKCSHILRFWGIGPQHIFLPCHALCAQSCPTLCDPLDCTLPGSSVHGIFQARILKWVVISSSRVSSRPRNRTRISCISWIVGRFFTHWTIREVNMSFCGIQFSPILSTIKRV